MAKCVDLQDRAARWYERAKEAEDLSNGVFKDAAGDVFAVIELASDGLIVKFVAKKLILDQQDCDRLAKWLKDIKKYRWSK